MLSREVADRERTKMFARYSLIGALSGCMRCTRGGNAGLAVPGRNRPVRGHQGDVRALRVARRRRRPALRAHSTPPLAGRGRRRRRSGRRGTSSTSSPPCSASMPSPAASSCSRCWRCGCSSASICRSSAASLFFFWAGVLSAFSFPVAAWLSRRIGLVNTMVFTHIPSSLCLILAAVRADALDCARACCWCAPRCRRWTCRRARPT